MVQSLLFAEIVEAADHLSPDEQAELIAILQRRLYFAARERVITEVQESRMEFASGRCAMTSVDDLMCEILQ